MLSLVVVSGALVLAGAVAPSPIGPAANGQLQCYTPNVEHKTCSSLAGYAPRKDGGFDNTGWVMVAPSPLIVMKTVTPVTLENDQVCGPILASDVAKAEFTLDGKPIPESNLGRLRDLVAKDMGALLGRKICTAYVADGAGSLIGKAFVEGQARPDLDQKVIWVSPQDGYQVGP